jgi:hypothetical protein
MSVSSPCEVCGKPDVDEVCDRCGQLVCRDHFDEALGYCIECAAAVRGEAEPEGGSDSEDRPDGVDTYRF